MPKVTLFTLEDICALLPHRPPFLFVDRVTAFTCNTSIETERTINHDEPFLKGHFPGTPIMPGVLVTDALAQTSGLLWGFSKKATSTETDTVAPPEIFFLAAANIKYPNPSYPGDTLIMTAQANQNYGSLYTYTVEAYVKRKVIAKGTLTLAMMKGSI